MKERREAEKKKNAIPSVIAICAITIIEIVALCHGINGKLMTWSIAAIAGIGGFHFKNIIQR